MHDWRLVRAGLLVVCACLGQQVTVPPDLARHLDAAQKDLDSQKYREAASELRAALAIRSEIRGAYYQLGFALFETHDFKEAEKAFTRELDFKPPDAYSLYYLGRIQADLGQPRQAISFYERSLDAGDVLD